VSLSSLRKLAAGLPGATEDIKWGDDLCVCIGGKMFAVFWPAKGSPQKCCFKVDAERFVELTGVPGVSPSPYLARAHWVQVQPGHQLTDLPALVRRSHALVAAGLTKKLQRELGLLA
jgi:predicted DNA-binding protein (MmcQ/YjbR family)